MLIAKYIWRSPEIRYIRVLLNWAYLYFTYLRYLLNPDFNPVSVLLFFMEAKRGLQLLQTYSSSAEMTEQLCDGSLSSSPRMKSPLTCCVQGWGYRRRQLLYALSALDGMDTSLDLHPVSSPSRHQYGGSMLKSARGTKKDMVRLC